MSPSTTTRGPAQRLAPILVLVLSTVVGALGAPVASAADSAATVGAATGASAGPCPGDAGVTIVVDPGDLGGPVQVRCVDSSPANGMKALEAAGYDVETTVRFSGFLCRIDGRPASDPCVGTPPANAYWSYWVADRGGPWCYSDLGATARTPRRGTVEGWSFSRGGDAAAPRSGTFGRLAGPQRLPSTECDRGPAPATTAPPGAPAPAAPPLPTPSIASATTIAPRSPVTTPVGADNITTTTTAATVAPPDSTTTPPTTAGPAPTAPETTTTTTEPSDGADLEERAASTVDLAESARSGPGSAAGTAVAVSAMGLLAGGAVLVNRRRLKPLRAPGSEGEGSGSP